MVTPIIILNWNGLDDTIECVESIINQSDTGFIIYLADNASGNNEFEKLRLRFSANSKINLIKNNTNVGFGKAHNLIFYQLIAEGYDTVALINNDAVADENWLSEARKAMQEEGVDIVACKMTYYFDRNKLDSAGLFMLNTGEILPRGHGCASNEYSKVENTISFCAGASLLKLDTIKEIGGFDDYFNTGYEDAEMGLRTYLSGRKILYAPDSIVYHKMGQSLNKVNSYKRTRKIQQDVNYTFLKNIPIILWLYNFPAYLIRALLILAIHILTFRFRYPVIWFDAILRTLFFDMGKIIRNRNKVTRHRTIREIQRNMMCFLSHDWYRFKHFVIKRNPHKFERN